jgi:hypothetical protein
MDIHIIPLPAPANPMLVVNGLTLDASGATVSSFSRDIFPDLTLPQQTALGNLLNRIQQYADSHL